MGRIADLVSTGVGLAAEAIQSRNSQNQQQLQVQPSTYNQQPQVQPSTYNLNGTQSGYTDDDGHDYPLPPAYSNRDEYNDYEDSRVSITIPRLPEQSLQLAQHLTCPVIIPQRRPENKSRGWMMAYAPILDSFGIGQAMFLEFIYDFNKSLKTSPYLDAINLAAFGVGFVPGVAPMAVSMGTTVAVAFAKKYQSERNLKSYLGRMNRELFEPHGLFAVVMTLQKTNQALLSVNAQTAEIIGGIAKYYNNDTFTKITTPTATPELPESAPLVFPSQEELAALRPQEGNKIKKMGTFTAEYLDRRAQAKYAQENPNSGLAVQNIRFNSSFADPRLNIRSKKDLLGALTGGAIAVSGRGDKTSISDMLKDRNDNRHEAGSSGLVHSLKDKALGNNVLYLMIAEKPSEESMDMIDSSAIPVPSNQQK